MAMIHTRHVPSTPLLITIDTSRRAPISNISGNVLFDMFNVAGHGRGQMTNRSAVRKEQESSVRQPPTSRTL
jgi:hypothetical protein